MKRLVLIFLLFLGNLSLADNERRLLMLFDSKALELMLGESTSILQELVIAIHQKCVPIIVSKSIWDNFILRRYRIERMIRGKLVSYAELLHYFGLYSPLQLAMLPFTLKKVVNDINVVFENIKQEQTNEVLKSNKEALDKAIEKHIQVGKEILEKFKKTTSPEVARTLERDFVCYLVPFDKNEWMTFIYQDALIILIPRNYYEECEQATSQEYKQLAQEFIDSQKSSLTLSELIIGIKKDHLITFDSPLEPTFWQRYFSMSAYKSAFTHYAILYDKALTDILVNRTDLNLVTLKENSDDVYEQLLHPWLVYINGHGSGFREKWDSIIENIFLYGLGFFISLLKKLVSAAQMPTQLGQALKDLKEVRERLNRLPENIGAINFIAGVSILEFKQILQFFNHQVLTRFLLYSTCFGGGKNAQEAFQFVQTQGRNLTSQMAQKIPMEFNYIIASGTELDAFTLKPLLTTIIGEGQRPFFETNLLKRVRNICRFFERLSIYFSNFGQKTNEPEEKNLADIINEIHVFKPEDPKHEIFKYYNIPMIRFAHAPWFFVDDVDKKAMRISPMTVKIAVANNESIIIKNKDIVFLEVHDIPVQMIIEGNMPVFLFAVPGNSNVHIKKIWVQASLYRKPAFGEKAEDSFQVFVEAFSQVEYESFTKSCTIESLDLGAGATQNFRRVVIVHGATNIPGYPGRNVFAYAERIDGMLYAIIATKTRRYSRIFKKESDAALAKYGSNLYNKLSSLKTITPEIEQGIEQRSLMEYSAEPIAQFLKKRPINQPQESFKAGSIEELD